MLLRQICFKLGRLCLEWLQNFVQSSFSIQQLLNRIISNFFQSNLKKASKSTLFPLCSKVILRNTKFKSFIIEFRIPMCFPYFFCHLSVGNRACLRVQTAIGIKVRVKRLPLKCLRIDHIHEHTKLLQYVLLHVLNIVHFEC